MKRLIKWLVVLSILGLVGGSVYVPSSAYLKERRRVVYKEAEVTRGRIAAVVNSTGKIQPVRSHEVGTSVSGPIEAIYADHNQEVKKGELLAKIDPRLYQSAVARDKAALATRRAELKRVEAELQKARNDEGRSKALRAENKGFISDAEMDQFRFHRAGLEAQFAVAEAAILQAQANLENSEANLGYTEIRSPVDGIVIDRKIDPGQTMASQFQVPVMFIVAADLRKEMHVSASVDEADIGQIRAAQAAGQPVRFTVDSHPDELFEGTIYQIRRNATITQNVVTYPVMVSAPNPDLKLEPSMTATISFQVGERLNVPRIPNAALRFFPQREQVREEDRPLLESAASTPATDDDRGTTARSAEEKAESRRKRNRRHVWVVDGELLRAIEVVTGINDSKYTELVEGSIKEGDKLVIGIQPKN